MSLDAIPAGARVLIDANILVYAKRAMSAECRRLVERCVQREECVDLGVRLADALEHLHRHQLIHRDIKPANIIFVEGTPKLADIGLVTTVAEKPQDVTYLGTKGYISPEGPGTPSSDVYGLGKVLYEAWTGLDREQFPNVPTELLTEVPPAFGRFNQILLKACETNPQDRYQSAAEMHGDLLTLKKESGGVS